MMNITSYGTPCIPNHSHNLNHSRSFVAVIVIRTGAGAVRACLIRNVL